MKAKYIVIGIIILLILLIVIISSEELAYVGLDESYLSSSYGLWLKDDSYDFSEYLSYLLTFGTGEYNNMNRNDITYYHDLVSLYGAKKMYKYDSNYIKRRKDAWKERAETIDFLYGELIGNYERKHYEIEPQMQNVRVYGQLSDEDGNLLFNADGSKVMGWYTVRKNVDVEVMEYQSESGLKIFHPIAEGYTYTHANDFGDDRSYGGDRKHMGNDIMGEKGTPIINMEGGTVYDVGWNQLGGWQITIVNDNRMYYYAHLDMYARDFIEGEFVLAGEVLGFMGNSGYSNVVGTTGMFPIHLHFQIRVDYDDDNKIWIDPYAFIQFTIINRAEVEYVDGIWNTRNGIK